MPCFQNPLPTISIYFSCEFCIRVISLAWPLGYFCFTLYIINTLEQTTLIEPTGAGGGKLNFVLKL